MNRGQETELESCGSSASEEDIWWKLFQLLIPGMDNHEAASLKERYWPCEPYSPVDTFIVNCLPRFFQITFSVACPLRFRL